MPLLDPPALGVSHRLYVLQGKRCYLEFELYLASLYVALVPNTPLRVIQSNDQGWVYKVGDHCWSGLKSFRDKDKFELRRTLFIFKRADGLRDFAVFDSVYTDKRDAENKYIFEVKTKPMVLKDQELMVHLMSRKEDKLAAVDLVERLGK